MSLYDYHLALRLSTQDHPFYALIMAAMRDGDPENTERLKHAFPEVYFELVSRYIVPFGVLESDGQYELMEVASRLNRPGPIRSGLHRPNGPTPTAIHRDEVELMDEQAFKEDIFRHEDKEQG